MLRLGRSSTSLKSSLMSFSMRGMTAVDDGLENPTVSHCLSKHKTSEKNIPTYSVIIGAEEECWGLCYSVRQSSVFAFLYMLSTS